MINKLASNTFIDQDVIMMARLELTICRSTFFFNLSNIKHGISFISCWFLSLWEVVNYVYWESNSFCVVTQNKLLSQYLHNKISSMTSDLHFRALMAVSRNCLSYIFHITLSSNKNHTTHEMMEVYHKFSALDDYYVR